MIFPVCPACSSCERQPSSETGREQASPGHPTGRPVRSVFKEQVMCLWGVVKFGFCFFNLGGRRANPLQTYRLEAGDGPRKLFD
jgi:hypothetical protein